ncbi:hypothetical protein JW935_24590 [candidate division KSB1 bacterium]|nr:hypothetical protein [candidate division KSB1 bacterium]
MKPTFFAITVLIIIFCAGLGMTQKMRAVEKRSEQREVVQDKKKIADDVQDLDRLSDLIIKWDKIRQTDNKVALEKIERLIAIELKKDVVESAVEVEQAKKEVADSKKDVNRSRRQAVRERRDQDGDRKAARRKTVKAIDEKKDLKDDVKDAAKANELFEKKKNVAVKLLALQKKIDATPDKIDKVLQEKQYALFQEYLKLSQQEINMGIREHREDIIELKQ